MQEVKRETYYAPSSSIHFRQLDSEHSTCTPVQRPGGVLAQAGVRGGGRARRARAISELPRLSGSLKSDFVMRRMPSTQSSMNVKLRVCFPSPHISMSSVLVSTWVAGARVSACAPPSTQAPSHGCTSTPALTLLLPSRAGQGGRICARAEAGHLPGAGRPTFLGPGGPPS